MKVFGREKEKRALLDFFFSPQAGESRTALVSGEAGIGKSALVRHLKREVADRGGLFLEVACNPINSSEVNFSAALEAVVKEVESVLKVEEWKQALTPFSDVVCTRLGGLAERLGLDSGRSDQLRAAQQSMRFSQTARLILNLLQSMATPVVLFWDDIQWADSESYELKRFLVTDSELSELRVVLAARTTHCGEARWSELTAHCQLHLPLEGLPASVVQELIESRIELEPQRLKSLTEQVAELSLGNPLYIATAVLLFSSGGHTLNPLDREQLLLSALELLPKESQTLLGQAACIGKRFAPELLALLSSIPESEIQLRLSGYVDRGFLLRQSSVYEFRHDKLREALQELIPTESWACWQKSLGKLLAGQSRTFVQGVEHLAQCLEFMNSQEKQEFAVQALDAAREAQAAGMVNRAFQLARKGAQAIGVWSTTDDRTQELNERWTENQTLACQLCLEAAEANEGSTEEELWKIPVSLLVKFSTDPVVRARTTLVYARALSRQNEHKKAIEVVEEFLKTYPDYRPLPKKSLVTAPRIVRLVRTLRKLVADDFKGMKTTEDPLIRLKQEMMTVQSHSSMHAKFDELPLYTIRECESLLFEGATNEGIHALLAFSVAVGWKIKQRALGLRVAEYCHRKLGDSDSGSALQALLLRELAIESRTRSTADLVQRIDGIHERCLVAGNIDMAVASIAIGSFHLCLSGATLPSLRGRLKRLKTVLTQYRARIAEHDIALLSWALSCYSGEPVEPPDRVKGVHDFKGQTIELQTFLLDGRRKRALEVALEEPADDLPLLGHIHLYFWFLAPVACYWGVRARLIGEKRAGRRFAQARKVLSYWCQERADRSWMLDALEGLWSLSLGRDEGVKKLISARTAALNQGMTQVAALLVEALADYCDGAFHQEASELFSRWKGVRPELEFNDEVLSRATEELALCSDTHSLCETFLALVQQTSTARRVLLISVSSRPYPILASLENEPEQSGFLDPENSESFPFSLLNTALSRKEVLVFQTREFRSFRSEPYFLTRELPAGITVIPISYQATVSEVLYLESEDQRPVVTARILRLLALQWKLFHLQLQRGEQLQLQQELLTRVRETRHQEALRAVALEARKTALATFLGIASHDLKAPLSAIGMWASQLPDGPEKENIQAASARATGLIHDYLDGMALELGNKIKLEKVTCDLADLVEQEIDHQLDALEPSVRSETRLQWELNTVELQADPLRLRQVIANLIGNALKHCPRGTPISVKTVIDSEEALFMVNDEGPGLSPEKRGKLFQAFETSSRRNGSGLGLWIVKKVVEAHRGRVGYDPMEPGSSFWVRLPLG